MANDSDTSDHDRFWLMAGLENIKGSCRHLQLLLAEIAQMLGERGTPVIQPSDEQSE